MICGIGTDVVEVARIEHLANRYGERFLKRVFTPGERQHCMRRKGWAACLAARFCAKEAFAKALGTGIRNGLRLTQIGVANNAMGKPTLELTGMAAELARSRNASDIHLSISHTDAYAVATVIIEA